MMNKIKLYGLILQSYAAIWYIPYIYHVASPKSDDWWAFSISFSLALWGFVCILVGSYAIMRVLTSE
jgi:hypothetical protein